MLDNEYVGSDKRNDCIGFGSFAYLLTWHFIGIVSMIYAK